MPCRLHRVNGGDLCRVMYTSCLFHVIISNEGTFFHHSLVIFTVVREVTGIMILYGDNDQNQYGIRVQSRCQSRCASKEELEKFPLGKKLRA